MKKVKISEIKNGDYIVNLGEVRCISEYINGYEIQFTKNRKVEHEDTFIPNKYAEMYIK